MDETSLATTRFLGEERRPALFGAPEKYQLVRILGSGGMGTVVLARDRSLGRLVALKFLRESCTTFMERFEREARLMARLEHPAIVPIHELGRHEGRMYLAMGYVRGGNLAQAELAPRRLAATLRRVVDALAFTHRNGIVHRDVKPENVLLDAKGRAFLGDFGLAFGPGEGSQIAGERPLAGTPLAMSPEQARGEVVGPASDVFSLGATMYKQLTGVWPFRGRTLADVLHAIEHAEPRAPRALEPDVPPALEKLVLRCLAKDPAGRFASMDELGEALDRFLQRRSLFQLLRPGRRAAQRTGPHIHPEDIS